MAKVSNGCAHIAVVAVVVVAVGVVVVEIAVGIVDHRQLSDKHDRRRANCMDTNRKESA